MKTTKEEHLWPDDQALEVWRLRLALLKESKAYRDFWSKHRGEKVKKAHEEIQDFYAAYQNEHYRVHEFCPEAIQIIQNFYDGLRSFDLELILYQFDFALQVLDPVNLELPNRLPVRFIELPPVVVISTAGTPSCEGRCMMQIGEALRGLKPSERLLKIDLSRKRGELIEEIKRFLDLVDYWRQAENRPVSMDENYSKWEPDKSRFRTECWQAIDIWRLRRCRQSFPDISQALDVKESTAKMAFKRVFELIEGRPYDPVLKRDILTVNLGEIKSPCDGCTLHATCEEPCPDLLQLADLDNVTQRELLIGFPEYSF